ncbi:antibiotic biosynthesis monooxygenase family protein, partial [Arthrospira platensis SPKY1]|nr:antibiotic biosynthesis monooxygenase family protein [Arthrospira platensis SPKY1]
MLIRIVKMGFKPECIADFVAHFDAHSQLIRQSPGNRHLELWQSQTEPHVFFTYSFWETAEDLENYRRSD